MLKAIEVLVEGRERDPIEVVQLHHVDILGLVRELVEHRGATGFDAGMPLDELIEEVGRACASWRTLAGFLEGQPAQLPSLA